MRIITSLLDPAENSAQRENMACLLTGLFTGEIDPAEVFTADYQQFTDGHTLDYQGFVQHLNYVRAQIREIAFTVEEISCQNHLLADRHIVTVTYPEGHQAVLEVYMFAALREGKIWRIHEVTRALSGNASDRALAHATQ
ncbi:TPA: nuclear transport factor 2 family protein [Enterobacter sichuanensis]|nr:nuclear transport factor 2 family protein [Enterobacter sichuanensis]